MWCQSSHARSPIRSQCCVENGVIIRLWPCGYSPIAAPRLSSTLTPSWEWMWRKWYTSKNASAVTFQLHGTMRDSR